MTLKAEGIWECTVLGAKYGEDDGAPYVQINAVIDEGPSKGMRCTYEDQVNAKSALYISRSCKNVGWSGRDGNLKTLETDCAEWIKKTGGKSTVEIKHIEIKRGKKYDAWIEKGCQGPAPVWDKCNSVGRGGARQLKPVNEQLNADANEAMRAAMEADGSAADEQLNTDDIPF